MSLRNEKLSKQILREVSSIINTGVKDPDLGFVTVTNVKMKTDVNAVTIFVSILGTAREKKSSIEALKRARGYIRRQLAASIQVKFVPEIEFELDTSMENIENTLKLINSLEKGRKSEK